MVLKKQYIYLLFDIQNVEKSPEPDCEYKIVNVDCFNWDGTSSCCIGANPYLMNYIELFSISFLATNFKRLLVIDVTVKINWGTCRTFSKTFGISF